MTDKKMVEHHIRKYIMTSFWFFNISKQINIEKYIRLTYNRIKNFISFSDYIIGINNHLCVSENFIDTYINNLDIKNIELSCFFKTKPSLDFFKRYKTKNICFKDLINNPFYKCTTSELYDTANIVGIEKFNQHFKQYYWLNNTCNIIIEDNKKSKILLNDKQFNFFQKCIKKS